MLEIKNVSKTFAKDTVNEHKALSKARRKGFPRPYERYCS